MAFRADRMRQARLALKEASHGRKGSQQWLADATGAHVTSISDWERGENQPTGRYIAKLASALEIPAGDLLDAEDEPLHRDTDVLEALYQAIGQALGKVAA